MGIDEHASSSAACENEIRRQVGGVEPSPQGKGRKKLRNPSAWGKNVTKKARYCSKYLPKLPNCNHEHRSDLQCSQLNMQDIRKFHEHFYSKTVDCTDMKVHQDNYVLKYTQSETPKRENRCSGLYKILHSDYT